MQVPKKKTSPSRKGMRRSHHALVPKYKSECKNCSASVAPHHVCLECGYYRGRQIIPVNQSATS